MKRPFTAPPSLLLILALAACAASSEQPKPQNQAAQGEIAELVEAPKLGPVDVLSNGGFEQGSLAEVAFDGFALARWAFDDCGGNNATATQERSRSGKWSMKHFPIGWAKGNDQKTGTADDDDAILAVVNKCTQHLEAGANEVTFEGYVDASQLDEKHQVVATLLAIGPGFAALSAVQCIPVQGGSEGWNALHAVMPLNGKEEMVILGLAVTGTKKLGAPGSAVYYDDLSLRYSYNDGMANEEPDEPLMAKVRVTDRVINTVRPEIFGDNIEWTNSGMGIFDPKTDTFDERVVGWLREAGVTHVRYPGGTLSDYFEWQKAVGDKRKKITNPFSEPKKGKPEFPYFGPAEFEALCRKLGAAATITLNAGTGSPEDAVAWVEYWKKRNLPVSSFTVGNEIYMANAAAEEVPDLPVAKTPEQYVAFYKACAPAIRAAWPEAKLGAIGLHDTGTVHMNQHGDWMRVILQEIGDQMDFIDVHNSYAPALRSVGFQVDGPISTDDAFAGSFLAASEYVRGNFEATKNDLVRFAPNEGKDIEIHITEYGPLVYPLRGTTQDRIDDARWNRSLAGALYQAMLFQVFLAEPKIGSANHLPLYQAVYGALVGQEWTRSTPKIWRNVVYQVFQAYRQMVGCEVLATEVEVPTYDSLAAGIVPALKDVPYIDVGAYRAEDGALSVFLVNRSVKR